MRKLMLIGLVLGLAGCAQTLVTGSKSVDRSDGTRRILNLPQLGDGILDCNGPGAVSQPGDVRCSEIPVIVLDTGKGCASLLPYNQLKVHVGRNKDAADVTWVLVAPAGYKFDPAAGIWFDHPGSTYDKVGVVNGSQGRKFRWNVRAQAAMLESGHQALVLPAQGLPCTPLDPKIVNTD